MGHDGTRVTLQSGIYYFLGFTSSLFKVVIFRNIYLWRTSVSFPFLLKSYAKLIPMNEALVSLLGVCILLVLSF